LNTSNPTVTPKTSALEVERFSPNIGAIVKGVDMCQPASAPVAEELRRLLVEHKVLFLRDQHIDRAQFVAFGHSLGTPQRFPFVPATKDQPEVIRVHFHDQRPPRLNAWHADDSWRPAPALATMLIAKKLPSCGGDTLFANMEKAYDGLNNGLRNIVDAHNGIHCIRYFSHIMRKRQLPESSITETEKRFPPTMHPLAKPHPVSGNKALFANKAFTTGIEGMSESESQLVLEELFRQAWIPEYQCRFQWEVGSVAIWDNYSSQHYPVADYFPEERLMERMSIIL